MMSIAWSMCSMVVRRLRIASRSTNRPSTVVGEMCDLPVAVDRLHRGPPPIVIFEAEGHDREIRLPWSLHALDRGEALVGGFCEIERGVEGGAERSDPMQLQRQPDLEPAKRPGQFGAEGGEVPHAMHDVLCLEIGATALIGVDQV